MSATNTQKEKSMKSILAAILSLAIMPVSITRAEVPADIAVAGETPLVILSAQGAQVYECKRGPSGALAWQFREPIATLIADGKTVGRHYAGPTWELADGSVITAKVVGRAAGATVADIPLLKLETASRRGTGMIAGADVIQRLATHGGVAEGACSTAGMLLSVPYTADYAFHKKAAAPAVR
jgi:hypothetical protein